MMLTNAIANSREVGFSECGPHASRGGFPLSEKHISQDVETLGSDFIATNDWVFAGHTATKVLPYEFH